MCFILPPHILATILFLITIALLLYKFSVRNFDYWKKKNVPYPKPLPLVGNFLEVIMLRSGFGSFLAKLYNEYQVPYFGIYILNNPYLVLRSPYLIKLILVKEFNNFSDHAMLCDEECDPIAGKMLTLTHNPEWRQLRTKLTPVFSTLNLKNMFELINGVSEEMNNYLKENWDKNSMDAKELCAKFTTDVIATCGFGISANSFQCEDAEFRKFGRRLLDYNWKTAICQTSYFIAPSLVKFFRLPFLDRGAVDFFKRIFWTTINKREDAEHKRNDLVDIIGEIRKQSTSHGGIKFECDFLAAQAIQFYGAGFETTSSTMAFTLYELCLHPDIQTNLRLEIKTVLSKCKRFTYEAIQEMKYLHKVLCGERFGLLVSKLGLARILSEYEVESTSDTPVPVIFDPRSLFPASIVGLPMKFKKLVPDAI